MSKKQKTIKGSQPASSAKQSRNGASISASYDQTPVWQVCLIDDKSDWGWSKIGQERWVTKILPKLKDFERMTWSEIERQNGGKTHGTNSHSIPCDRIIKKAQDRLSEMNMDDLDEIFSLRLEGKIRIFGKRIGRVLQIIWFDFEHEICPSQKD